MAVEYTVMIELDEGADIKNVLVELVENMSEVQKCTTHDHKLQVKAVEDSASRVLTMRSAAVIDLRKPPVTIRRMPESPPTV